MDANKGPKRSKVQRDHDFARTAELALRGWTQAEIAREIGVSRRQVSHDLAIIRGRWQREADEAMGKIIGAEYVHLCELRKLAMAAWERSCNQRTVSTARRTVAGAAADERNETSLRREDCVGDPRFLAELRQISSEIRKLFGADAAPENIGTISLTVEQMVPIMTEAKKLNSEWMTRRLSDPNVVN